MSDPYKTLNVSPTASDDEIKAAYRELAKKYHPDNYADSPLSDLASEKMKEINEAYDAIVAERKNGYAANDNQYSYGYGYQQPAGGSSSYPDVRQMIMSGRIADAEQILNGVPQSNRDAEWYFLKGKILFKRGWLEDAFSNFQAACRMDPGNQEYRAAINRVNAQRSGMAGGYNMNPNATANTACNCCSNLICADCCCECMGGDLIPCC